MDDGSSIFVGTVRRSGSSLIVTVPKPDVKKLGLHVGDQVWVKIKKLELEKLNGNEI